MLTSTHNASQKIHKATFALRNAVDMLSNAGEREGVSPIPVEYQAELTAIVNRLGAITGEWREIQPTSRKCVGGCGIACSMEPRPAIIERPGLDKFLAENLPKHGCGC